LIGLVKRIRQSKLYQGIRNSGLGRKCSPLFHAINVLTSCIISTVYSRHGYRISIAGTHMYVDPRYIMITNICPEEPMLERLLSQIEPGDTFIDVGAYIGTYSIPIAKMHNGTVRVIAFEPAPHCAEVFRKHLKYNHVQDNVCVEERACSDSSGTAYFDLNQSVLDYPPASEGLMRLDKTEDRADDDRLIEIQAVTIDHYTEANALKPDYIKIDVEGAELQVLEGARNVLREYRPVVFCELHKFNWDSFHTSESKLRDYLAEVGYEMKDAITGKAMRGLPPRCHVILRPAE